MSHNFYIYLLVMAIATLSLRMLPLLLLRKPIKNKFIKSFLYYVPYVTLALMTFPSIMNDTSNPIFGLCAFILALILAFKNVSMILLTSICCLLLLILELIF